MLAKPISTNKPGVVVHVYKPTMREAQIAESWPEAGCQGLVEWLK
jgi:hypothetical protein